ncbi:MAG: hypothetical protein ABUL41_01180 [Chitinophagaceae bacterium]
MKTIFGIIGGIIVSSIFSSVQAQQTWDAKKNPTVDSISTPFESKLLPPRAPITVFDIFPAIGSYESSVNTDAPSVTIKLDEQNKGVVWVEGLPQGKIKAMLRKSPATYKIPEQKTEDGKIVPEGTLIFDKDMNTLSINIGKPYNAEDPALVFMKVENEDMAANDEVVVKTKTKIAGKKVAKTEVKQPKPWTYIGTKVEKGTALNQ